MRRCLFGRYEFVGILHRLLPISIFTYCRKPRLDGFERDWLGLCAYSQEICNHCRPSFISALSPIRYLCPQLEEKSESCPAHNTSHMFVSKELGPEAGNRHQWYLFFLKDESNACMHVRDVRSQAIGKSTEAPTKYRQLCTALVLRPRLQAQSRKSRIGVQSRRARAALLKMAFAPTTLGIISVSSI